MIPFAARARRRTAAAVAAAAAAASLLAPVASAGAQDGSAPDGAGPAAVIAPDWKTPVVDKVNISMSSPVVVPLDPPFVVVGDEGGNLRAFHLHDGSPVPGWSGRKVSYAVRAPLSTDGHHVFVPVAQDGKDRYPSFVKLKPTGALVWNSNPGINHSQSQFLLAGISLVLDGGRWNAFGASSGHWYYGINAQTGAQRWGFRNADSTMATPAIADVFGLGQPQIITSNDKSPETPQDKAGGHLRITSFNGRQICSADQLANGLTYAASGYNNSSPAIAEIDGQPLIVFGSTGPQQTGPGGNQIVAYDATCKLRWASPPFSGRAEPSPTFADVMGDATPEVLMLVDIVDGSTHYPRVYVLDAKTGQVLRNSGTSLKPYGAGHVRYTQASSIVTADVNGDGAQDLFVPANNLLVLDGKTGDLLHQLDMQGATIQNTPVITAEPGGVRVTIAGYAGNNGNGVSGGVLRSWELDGAQLGSNGWPRFGHDSQLTGLYGALDGPYDQLVEGQSLLPGRQLVNKAGNRLVMQNDGNLVLLRPNNTAAWSSQTNGNPGARLTLDGDGNAKVISSSGKVLWQSFARGVGVERLVLGADGHVRIYQGTWKGSERTNADRLLFSTAKADVIYQDRLYAGQNLKAGERLRSPNGQYELRMQTDGNLVIYRLGAPRWFTGTKGNGGRLALQTDGNLVLYNGSNGVMRNFALNGKGGIILELTNQGLLQVLNKNGGVVWQVSGA